MPTGNLQHQPRDMMAERARGFIRGARSQGREEKRKYSKRGGNMREKPQKGDRGETEDGRESGFS